MWIAAGAGAVKHDAEGLNSLSATNNQQQTPPPANTSTQQDHQFKMAIQPAASLATTSADSASTPPQPSTHLPTSTQSAPANQPIDDGYVPGQSANKSSFTTRYAQATSYLPASVSSRLPSAEAAGQHVGELTSKLGVIGGAAAERATHMARSGSERVKGIDLEQFKGKLTPEMVTKSAWSVRNETQVALNVSGERAGCGAQSAEGSS